MGDAVDVAAHGVIAGAVSNVVLSAGVADAAFAGAVVAAGIEAWWLVMHGD